MRHVETYPHTLLPRFMGAHRLIVPELGKVRLIRTTSDVLLTTADLNDYLLLSYHALSDHVLSYHVLSYHVLSNHVLSDHVLVAGRTRYTYL